MASLELVGPTYSLTQVPRSSTALARVYPMHSVEHNRRATVSSKSTYTFGEIREPFATLLPMCQIVTLDYRYCSASAPLLDSAGQKSAGFASLFDRCAGRIGQQGRTKVPRNDVISTSGAPAAIGPYSQVVKANGFVFTAGQIPLDPETGNLVEGGITEQTERVMKSLAAVLEAAGTSYGNVVKSTCFLVNLDDFPAFNEVYAKSFGDNPPARSTVQVAKLPRGSLVEVECVATY